MKKIFAMVLSMGIASLSLAQDSTNTEPVKDKRPIRYAFESSYIIDNHTTEVANANTLEFMIQHRFGTLNTEEFDLLGLYAPSNIRIGLNYGITNNINIGIGTTKMNKLQDLNLRWNILKQTRSGSIPVSVTYYGNAEYDLRKDESFGIQYKRAHRLSYFHEIMVSRMFGPNLSLQVSGNYSHFNQIDTSEVSEYVHDNFGVSFAGRYKVTPTLGVLFLYSQPLTTPENIKPGYGLGVQIGTSAHIFQVFLTTANAISRQSIQSRNINDLGNKDILIGFNISRMWFF